MRRDYPELPASDAFQAVPPEFRPFLDLCISAWRGHRLFGLEEPPMYNYVDLRGMDCLISIGADEFLGTQSEHEHGLSIWQPRDDMASGQFEGGLFIRHSNG
ncbi:hypothetical protein [Falsiphaeobacter marinintestinus]|uniref:hypothetical protein n=1 Tax=Falsiphaeobacter marinintestinus TaxID=1492905 RepID=UPI0011B848F2|nr:hypothetical protein [Phaeobacter marinintestinus]